MIWRALAVLAMVIVLAQWPTAASAQTPGCRFVLGFAALRDLVGAQKVGSCLEDEHFNLQNGNAEQRTTGGLLVWRKVDNFTAFTDGSTSWINGPNGLQSRPNNERFSWERDPVSPGQAAPPPAPSSSVPPPTPSPSPSPPAPTTTAASSPGAGRAQPTSPTTCPETHPIKGNKSSSGELIYHSPGGALYERTQAEACFATGAAAEAAGYRASLR